MPWNIWGNIRCNMKYSMNIPMASDCPCRMCCERFPGGKQNSEAYFDKRRYAELKGTVSHRFLNINNCHPDGEQELYETGCI